MRYLLDSDWAVDWLKGTSAAARLQQALRDDELAISTMTYGEVYEGIYYGRDPRTAERVFQNFLRGVDVLPLSRQVMRQFARIRGALRASGQLIGDPDVLIAATAVHSKRPLITRNVRHFGRIPQLQIYQP